MLATRQKVLRRFWYPVMPAAMLDDGPKPFVLLGEAIVLWRDAAGKAVCVKDRCCHRSARLSLGFLEDGNVVCGYHGWTFDGTGTCVRIPQRLDMDWVGKISIPAYRCEERYGHVWVALDEPLSAIPDIPEAEEAGFRKIDQFYEVWNIGALRLMENSFDQAHVAYVHRETFGNVEDPTPVRSDITDTDLGFEVRLSYGVKTRGVQKKNLHAEGESEDTVRTNHSMWFMPFSRRLGITYPNGLRHTIFTAATPMTDDKAMIVQFCFRNDTEEDARAEDIIAFDRAVTLEDKLILEGTDPDVPLTWDDENVEFNMMTDRPGVRMRKRLLALLAEHGESEARREGPWVPAIAAE